MYMYTCVYKLPNNTLTSLHVHIMYVHCTFVCVACVVQHRMTKMVRKYLSKKHVIQEEDLLEMIADNTDRSENVLHHFYTFTVLFCPTVHNNYL